MQPSGSVPLDEGPNATKFHHSKCEVIPSRHFYIEGKSFTFILRKIIMNEYLGSIVKVRILLGESYLQ